MSFEHESHRVGEIFDRTELRLGVIRFPACRSVLSFHCYPPRIVEWSPLAEQGKPNSIHTGGGHYDQPVKLTLKAADPAAKDRTNNGLRSPSEINRLFIKNS
jgi:hypothetical protein